MTECALTPELGSPQHMAEFTRRAIRGRVPVSGSFDLTYRCNLRCVHCYAGHLTSRRACEADELGTAQVLRLLSGAAASGCLTLLFSGGEPMVRPDFAEVYRAARRLGMLVTVFSNATMLSDEVLGALVEYPPLKVEVSVYGASEAVYERVAGVPGSFRRAWQGIDRLTAAGVRVGLKTMILRENAREVAAVEETARRLGMSFRLDPLVTPRLDGHPAPLAQRVDPRTAVDLELASEKRLHDTAAYAARQKAKASAPDLYRCGAGVMAFHLDPAGVLRPCLMSRAHAFPAAGPGFAAAWRQAVAAMSGLRMAAEAECAGCPHVSLCGYCPGLFALETGSVHGHSDYVCKLGETRTAMVAAMTKARIP